MKKPITVISTTRRPEQYKQFLLNIERELGEFIESYLGFTNDLSTKESYKALKSEFPKLKIVYAPDNFIFKNGFDKTYNLLLNKVSTEYAWMLFDVDEVIVSDKSKFAESINGFYNYVGIPTHMQRGDSLEVKYQLYKTNLIRWEGAVHENQAFLGEVKSIDLPDTVIKVLHKNAVDTESSNLKKTDDGFIILERTTEGSDSDKRNMLYEGLTYRIVYEGLPHRYRGWFIRHYEINKEIIDWYYGRAIEKWK